MKPGDIVRIRQTDGFVTMYKQRGEVTFSLHNGTPMATEVGHMIRSDVGLVIAVTGDDEDDCSWTECMVLWNGHFGWRNTDRFEVL